MGLALVDLCDEIEVVLDSNSLRLSVLGVSAFYSPNHNFNAETLRTPKRRGLTQLDSTKQYEKHLSHRRRWLHWFAPR